MSRDPHPVIVLHSDAIFLERLQRGVHGNFEVRRVGNWDELTRMFPISPASALVVVDPFVERGSDRAIARELFTFLWHFPSATVVAAFRQPPSGQRDFWTLSRCGVSDVLYLDVEGTEEQICRRLTSVRARSLQRLRLEATPLANRSGRCRAILEAATDVVAMHGRVQDLARKLCVSRQTLVRWCKVCSLPPPRVLLRWIRALEAAAMLDDPGQTVRNVSRACGYADDRGLRRLFRGLADLPPSELRARGAFPILERAFRHELHGKRERGPSNSTPQRNG